MASAGAFAGAESGFYIGAGAGQWDFTLDFGESLIGGDEEVDGDDMVYKIIGGFNFGVVPLIDLAVEVNYNFFDEVGEDATNGRADIDVHALNAFGLAGLSFGPVGLYAKAGVTYWEVEYDLAGSDDDEDGTDPVYGAGARLQLGNWSVRAEYEYYDLDDIIDVETVTASVLYTF